MRNPLDAYYTQDQALMPLLPWWMHFSGLPLIGTFCEPCRGKGAIANYLTQNSELSLLWSNDIQDSVEATEHRDASQPYLWEDMPKVDYVVTNPPYAGLAAPIIWQCLKNANIAVAVLVRLNFLERCQDRDDFPDPNIVLILPRQKWNNTEYSSGDKITHCWLIWDKRMTTQHFKTLSKKKLFPEDFPEKSLFGDRYSQLLGV